MNDPSEPTEEDEAAAIRIQNWLLVGCVLLAALALGVAQIFEL